ncbi:MAG: hypothetical protein AAGD32_08800 [Planctomycetota bacterium]
MRDRFPPGISEKLGYYVYLYIDPRDGRPFYVGHGKGHRAFQHLADTSETEKVARIAAIRNEGLEPRIDLLKWGINRDQARLIEATTIDAIGLRQLTNQVSGNASDGVRRIAVEDLIPALDGNEAIFDEPAVLFKIPRVYDPDMSPIELYDATRAAWRMNPDKHEIRYAMAVFGNVIREVYRVVDWFPAGSTMQELRRDFDTSDGRVEFVGRLADEDVRRRFRGKTIPQEYIGGQSPYRYVGGA